MSFLKEMTRAAAQRGGLDPVFQELSDDWTLILQRLFPVWALLGPGLSEPGHIELRTRTVYLDSDELLGSREQILAGTLETRAILRTFGVGIHEVLHAKGTKLWVTEHDGALRESGDPADRQLAIDRALVEEPRMEATGCRAFPDTTPRGRFIRRALGVAVADCIVPRFVEQTAWAMVSGRPPSRDTAGRAATYLWARTHYGVVDPASLSQLCGLWRQVLGARDWQTLDDFYADLIWVPSGDTDALSDAARRYRDIIGPPDPPTSGGRPDSGSGAAGADHDRDRDGDGNGGGDGDGDASGHPADDAAAGARSGPDSASRSDAHSGPDVGSFNDALEHALEHTAQAQLEQFNEDVDLAETLKHANARGNGDPQGGRGGGTGAPTGRIPDRGVDRPPFPDEVQAVKRLADRLARAMTLGTKRIDKRTPGGRFNARSYTRGRAEKATKRPVTARPWEVRRQITAPIEEPHIELVVDTSGSMYAYEYALGPIVWILTEAFRVLNGRIVTVLFGNGAELMSDGTRPLRNVPAIKVGGGTAFGGDAIAMGAEHLELTNPRRPRALYVISDGGWYDTAAGVAKIREMREHGAPTVHLSIGCEPLSVEADRVCVIQDPADALDLIANDTIAALRARAGGR